jgi:hypothetical protein
MNDGRGVIAGVNTVYRVGNNGFSKKTFFITDFDAFVHRGV